MKSDVQSNMTDFSTLTPKLQKEFSLLENDAQEELLKFTSRLKSVTKTGAKTLQESLNQAGLTLQDKTQTKKIFNEAILQPLEMVATNILKYSLGRKDNVSLSVLLLESTIDVLDSIQDFKMKIDKTFPIKSDEIIKHAIPALLFVTNIYSPGLNKTLKNTGALEKIASFLKDDSLKSTIDNLRDSLGKMNQQKGLETVNKVSELSAQTGVLPTSIAKLNLDSKTLGMVTQSVAQTPSLKSFIGELSSYAEKILPKNTKEIDATLQRIKESSISSIKKLGVSEEVIKKVEKRIDEGIFQVKGVLKETLNTSIDLFEKMKLQQHSATKMLDCIKDITSTIKSSILNSKNANFVIKTVVEVIQNEVKNRLQGNIVKIATQLQDPKTRDFAKKVLGVGYANLMDLEKTAKKSLEVKSSRVV